jgi:hypothetical protein
MGEPQKQQQQKKKKKTVKGKKKKRRVRYVLQRVPIETKKKEKTETSSSLTASYAAHTPTTSLLSARNIDDILAYDYQKLMDYLHTLSNADLVRLFTHTTFTFTVPFANIIRNWDKNPLRANAKKSDDVREIMRAIWTQGLELVIKTQSAALLLFPKSPALALPYRSALGRTAQACITILVMRSGTKIEGADHEVLKPYFPEKQHKVEDGEEVPFTKIQRSDTHTALVYSGFSLNNVLTNALPRFDITKLYILETVSNEPGRRTYIANALSHVINDITVMKEKGIELPLLLKNNENMLRWFYERVSRADFDITFLDQEYEEEKKEKKK